MKIVKQQDMDSEVVLKFNYEVNFNYDEVTKYYAEIYYNDALAGHISARYMHCDLLEQRGASWWVLFDGVSSELAKVYMALFDGPCAFRDRLNLQCWENWDVLHIHQLVIDPKYQNRGIGTRALNYFLYSVGRVAAVATLIVEPLEKGVNGYVSSQAPDKEQLKRKLVKFYHRLGFKSTRCEKVYYLDFSNRRGPDGKLPDEI